ncbi:MAG: LysR family transcriptional regulator [Halomonas sp.]|jgi:DNA-binding transcriptional LysR family regulator|uniref:LysR family transcriptional regulator n=1 Tax=Halomonas sp. MCCC 1A11057 TaxID=2733482 RepID=UPI001F200273|nr:LysR family transcriptional regulator [Halomonas sp. MCCC 1A11057]MCE8031966.1 LysR family transcriptional regulator [Halomonas sp. MCCC 1A11057]MDX5432740.1 LysR family transcriptional regulator [Halomonas sp.]MDX5502445.1 LysR family transcriptional regulator [Halomonas sp.]
MSRRKEALSAQPGDADLRLLKIYRKVVECGGFSAAEVELNISRAAISMAMNDLETRLGLRLCQRGRSGFSLTDEGAEVYQATLQLLAAVEGFRTRVNGLHAWLKGELNIGITDNLVTMPQMHITNSLSALKERGPDVRINIRMIPPSEIELGVLDGRLHTGVIPSLKTLPGLDYLPLYAETSQLYCASGHPLFEAEDVTEHQLANCDAVVPAYAQTPEVKALHEPLRAAASATDREGIAFLILSNRYIGYLPTHYAERWVGSGRMRALNPARWHYLTHYSAITRKGAPPNLVLETYLEELRRLQKGE